MISAPKNRMQMQAYSHSIRITTAGQAAVHIRIITEIVEVDGKSVGTSDPSDGGNQRTGKLETDILPFIGQPGVQRDEKERQQRQRKKRPETNQAGNESVQHRKVTE